MNSVMAKSIGAPETPREPAGGLAVIGAICKWLVSGTFHLFGAGLLPLSPGPSSCRLANARPSREFGAVINPKDLARYVDHTLLKAAAVAADIEKLCREARDHEFFSVCVNGSWVQFARDRLEGSEVKVACVVGFPLGAMDPDVKRYETEAAVDAGAHEIDVVLNVGRLKDADDKFILRELRDVVEAADERTVKVIIETAFLSPEEKIRACHLVDEAGAHFVKTSSGFGPSGATVDDVRLLRANVGEKTGVKASGGIRDLASALAMIEAGATRLGTSSGVAIVQGASGPAAY